MSSTASVDLITKERTFQYDESLPPLPVPELDKTLHKYLQSVKPLVTEEEFARTQEIVTKFGQTEGLTLHQQLLQRAKTKRNWMEEWWEKYAYLSSRQPLAVTLNMFGPFFAVKDVWPPWEGTQLERTSIFLTLALRYFQEARRETLPVMKSASGEQTFDMTQVKAFFCSSRIPGESVDEIVRYFKTEQEGPCPNHIIVTCNGHIFKMDNLFEENGEVVGSLELVRRLSMIKERSRIEGQCICILTADDRPSWAKSYEHMCALDPMNEQHLDTINKAILVIALDPEKPTNISEIMLQSMAGPNGHNRWFDKSYNVISFENGTSGMTGDHAHLDGVVVAVFSYYVHTQLRALKDSVLGDNMNPLRSDPEEIIFTTDQQVEEAKLHAANTYKKLADNVEVICSEFWGYGKKYVKSVGYHPDAFMQLALQLAYYRMYGRCVPCYETATTRQYYHGRTETVRSTTQEALDWCRAMVGNSHTNRDRHQLLKEAHDKHMQLMNEAKDGQGVDRHLLGLYVLAMESGEGIPELFSDPSYTKSGGGGNFTLSTSLVGYVPVQGAVSAMCNDGYGCFYNIEDQNYRVVVTGYKNSPSTDIMRFFESITQSLLLMKSVVTQSKL